VHVAEEKQRKEAETQPRHQQTAKLKGMYDQEREENERLRRELQKANAAPVIIATPPPATAAAPSNPVFQRVVTAEQ
jgi:hypothetical protein